MVFNPNNNTSFHHVKHKTQYEYVLDEMILRYYVQHGVAQEIWKPIKTVEEIPWTYSRAVSGEVGFVRGDGVIHGARHSRTFF